HESPIELGDISAGRYVTFGDQRHECVVPPNDACPTVADLRNAPDLISSPRTHLCERGTDTSSTMRQKRLCRTKPSANHKDEPTMYKERVKRSVAPCVLCVDVRVATQEQV